MTPLRRDSSIRSLLFSLAAVGVVYVASLTLEIGLILVPAAARLQGSTTVVLADHDLIAERLAAMRASLDQVRGLAAGRPATEARSLAVLTTEIRRRLDNGVAMRASVERARIPPEMRMRLAEAVESETAAGLALLDALRAIDLGRNATAAQALDRAGNVLDQTAVHLAAAQRAAIADVLSREDHLIADLRWLTWWAVGWVGLGVVLLLVCGWLLRVRLYLPIADLERAVDRITGGDLATRVTVLRHDELGRLGEHVNRMTEVLRAGASETRRRHENLTERFGRILDESSNEIYLFAADSLRIVQANRGARENLGYTMEELAALTPLDLLRQRGRESFLGDLALLRRGDRERLLLTDAQTRKDGTTYPVELTLQYSTSGEAPLFVAVVEDVSARSRVRELNERIRQFAFSHHRLLGSGDLTAALNAIADLVADVLYATRAMVWLRTPEGLRGLAGIEHGAPVGVEGWRVTVADFPEYLEALDQGGLLVVTDAAQDPRTRVLVTSIPGRAGVAALLAAPIRAGGKTVAVLVAEQDGLTRQWTAEEQAFLGSVGDLGALAFEAAERQALEGQLAQAKKMDSIGRLAGGVAHDFNNLLTAILGHVNFARGEVPPGGPLQQELDEIENAANRAAELTRQLLTFARRQVIEPRSVDLNQLTGAVERLLRRLIGEDIELVTVLAPLLWHTRVDPGQFEQVLVNLAVNARDAMPGGGRLVIETLNVVLDEAYAAAHPDTVPGEYVQLAVTDSGMGMDRATVARLFEPFFTTKEAGRGTGLGLAICYGIVRQAGGNIWVYSEPGRGTTFKVNLPRVDAPVAETPVAAPIAAPTSEASASAAILVVEDEPAIRELIVRVLSKRGYTVVAVSHAEEALRQVQEGEVSVDLIITDVVLPKMGGPQLVRELRRTHPELPVLYISGYTAESTVDQNLIDDHAHFLSKPFGPTELVRTVGEVLALRGDEGATSPSRT